MTNLVSRALLCSAFCFGGIASLGAGVLRPVAPKAETIRIWRDHGARFDWCATGSLNVSMSSFQYPVETDVPVFELVWKPGLVKILPPVNVPFGLSLIGPIEDADLEEIAAFAQLRYLSLGYANDSSNVNLTEVGLKALARMNLEHLYVTLKAGR